MKNANYRKYNDRTLNSSTYHKKDGTPIRHLLKEEAQKEIEEAKIRTDLDYLLTLPLDELRERQEIVRKQMAVLSKSLTTDEVMGRMQDYEKRLQIAVDKIAFP